MNLLHLGNFLLALLPALALAGGGSTRAAPPPVEPARACDTRTDPPRDDADPATNIPLTIPSHGGEMNAVMFRAAGAGPKPTLVLLHGLPGHERNLDLAQAVRRCGWNVLTFTYRGAWGSPGAFSIGGAVQDAGAALDYVRTPQARRELRVDPRRVVMAGHSMGGFAAALETATEPSLAGLILIDAWNAGRTAAEIRAAGPQARAALVSSVQLGHALQGTDPETLADELLSSTTWNLLGVAPGVARVPVLTVFASEGFAAPNRELATALAQQPGARVEAVELRTGHDFADQRIALAEIIAGWLQALPRP